MSTRQDGKRSNDHAVMLLGMLLHIGPVALIAGGRGLRAAVAFARVVEF